MNVLLIEDNAGDARLIQEMLRTSPTSEAINFRTATTLAEGLAIGETTHYDVVLLDLSLPDSLGIETLAQVHAAMDDTAIVVLTGTDDQKVGVRAVQMGAQDYLPKGDVDSKVLKRALRYAVERHRIESNLRRSEEEYRSLIDDVFDTSMVGVIILDQALKVVWCNEATEVYFGIAREQIVGQNKRELIDGKLKCVFEDPDDYASRLFEAYDLASFTDRFECHIMPAENRDERWLEHWSQPIRSGMYEGGRIEQYMDITDRKLLELAEMEQRQFAEALRDTIALLTSTLNLEEVLSRILTKLGRVVSHDFATITISDRDHLWITRLDRQTSQVRVIAEGEANEEDEFYFRLAKSDGVICLDESDSPTMADGNRIRSYIVAPIRWQRTEIGFISVFSTRQDFFQTKDSVRLFTFAEQAAIAIQNARLHQQSQELAALEERQRLARDLHDSVSQTLFTCRAMSESVLRRWDRDPQGARNLLEEVHQLTVTALSEMRVLLLELRPTALTQVSLRELFQQYLQPIQERRQFSLTLNMADLPDLPPDVQIGLYRIAQEALNNIDKHADASHVEIEILTEGRTLNMRIRDDGDGFQQGQVGKSSLGLDIMQERARAINATLDINTEIGAGTCVHIVWVAPERKGD
ncbi:MAG: response regulator [Anaerolineaceae bacterium]|nr:MAG: response regulator [Anaerolineaceae bacterium]